MMQISKEGEKFLTDTKVYLLTKGIKEEDIDIFLEDAELHLVEGEKKGKTVKDIFGDSPKEYADELAKEMEVDKVGNMKTIFSMIIGIGGYWLLTNILFHHPNHQFTLTDVQVIGYPIVLLITIIGTIIAFRMSSFQSKIKEFSMIYIIILTPILLLVLLMFLNKWYGTPVLQLSIIQSYILAAIIFLLLIIGEVYVLGWIGIFVILVPFSIMFIFKQLEEQSVYWGILEILLLYISLYVLMRLHIKLEEKKKNNK
ncbi:NADH dehydrogenase subunit N [Bacillus cytotoxicus NVH 391-98]|uniref:NADH dehydrogenase subunit N n=2 Tax=Bacillus TaxID=1386 RepID=A7GS52_BACCN|nr:NADH dehydrogenase subunit N [Bacillus cytotoxicus NVH 391-98]